MRTSDLFVRIVRFTTVALILTVGISQSSASITAIGDPIEGNSWGQGINESGVGTFDMIAAQIVSGGPLEAQVFRSISVAGWTDQPTAGVGLNRTLGIAQGPLTTNITFNLWFIGSSSTPLSVNLFAYRGSTLVDSALASWSGHNWTFTNGASPTPTAEALNASIVPEPASLVVWSMLGLAIGSAGFWRRRKRAV